ncbi:hyaluronan mediated motility receptor-like [Venturia canescens]|uniref:hyaluronan mediated motility receptor-like n=1 Tax=Venturia canescens TaxID=32260 RepID=UPI001C9CE77F|nr:hyaluronan mediated motility receptor-like [Venturia canescens]
MSFSKARIQRFNELTSEAPPPGAYDPKFDNKVKGIAIEKKERFQDSKSVTSSGGECNSSVSSKGARTLPSPKFRTPQLPKKRPAKTTNALSCPKAKTKLVLGASNESKYDAKHELADLKVECINKDRTIHDHANQIEEMKKETWRLEKELADLRTNQVESEKLKEQLSNLRAKQAEMEEQHKKDLESMAKLQQDIMDSRDQKHSEELQSLRLQLSEMKEKREREIAAQNTARDDEMSENSALLANSLREMRIDAEFEIDRLTEELSEVRSAKAREIDEFLSIVNDKENELASVQAELNNLKTVSDELRDRLTRLEKEHDVEIADLRNEEDILRDQVVELSKSKNDLETKLETRQQVILELQSQLSTVQCEVDELRAEYERMLRESETKLNEMSNLRDCEFIDLKNDLIREREQLEDEKFAECSQRLALEAKNKELRENNDFLTEELQDVQKLYKESNKNLKDLQEQLNNSEKTHIEEVQRYQNEIEAMRRHFTSEQSRLEELLEKARLDYIREIDNMAEARNKELAELKAATERTIEEEKRRIQERADKIVENAEAVTRETLAACRAESEERVKRVILESDTKVKSMVRDAKKAVEEEMREAADRYATCLARVEAERLELEKKVNQRDAEMEEMSVTIEELKVVVENQESFSQSLQADLDRAEAELAERKDEIRTLKDQMRAEAAEMVARRRKMEVVMAENQASVAALSQQLSESNAEVERLQTIIKSGEESINEHRGLLSAMRNTSKILTKEVFTLMEQLDANKSIVDQLEAVNLAEIESVRSRIYAEIDSFKSTTVNEITRLQEENKKKDEQVAELKKNLEMMAGKVDEAHQFLLKMEELEDTRVIEISQLQLDNEKLVRELKTAKDMNSVLETRESACKNALHEARQEISQLKERVEALEVNSIDKEKVRIMQEQYEVRLKEERHRRQIADEESKKLSEDCENLRTSYHEVSEKYAEMIGHHNHKQRVKHLNQLKDKIIRLEQDAESKKHIIDQQTRTIEKLKAEEKRSFARGKENIHSHGLSRSPYATPASSPLKQLTPLRDRNE